MSTYNVSLNSQRTLSISGSQSNTESFTNIKNPSLESIDELSSLRNFTSNTESCFNSHHQQILMNVNNHQHQTVTTIITASTTPATQAATTTTTTNNITFRSKSLSPHTPQSPKDLQQHIEQFPNSPVGHQPNEFVNDEYYIDESLPSSLSIETGQSQGEFVRQLDTANNVVALLQVFKNKNKRIKKQNKKKKIINNNINVQDTFLINIILISFFKKKIIIISYLFNLLLLLLVCYTDSFT